MDARTPSRAYGVEARMLHLTFAQYDDRHGSSLGAKTETCSGRVRTDSVTEYSDRHAARTFVQYAVCGVGRASGYKICTWHTAITRYEVPRYSKHGII